MTRATVAKIILAFLAPLLLVTFSERAVAQSQGDQAPDVEILNLTLEEIIQIGIDASPKLMAQRHVVDHAEAEFKQAKAGRLPRMEYIQIVGPVNQARGNVFYSPDAREDLLNGVSVFTRLELMVNQPLYTFGRLRAYIDAAQHGLEAKTEGLRRFRLALIQSLKELYYTLQLNEDLYRIVSDTEEQFTKAVEKAEELIYEDEGTLTQHELIKLRYGLARTSGRLLEIEKGRHVVHAAIKRLLYLPQGQDFELASNRLKPLKIELKDLEFYKDLAVQQRPEWRELDEGILAREFELKAEKRKYFPDIFASGLFRYSVAPNRDEQENPFVVEDFNYLYGGIYLGCRLELDFGLPQRIAAKRAELLELVQDKRDAVSGMLLEVEKSYREVLEKTKSLKFARKSRKNGRALVALNSASFHMGLSDSKEIFEAFGIYTEASAEYYMAVRNFNIAVAELARTTGLSFLADQPSSVPHRSAGTP